MKEQKAHGENQGTTAAEVVNEMVGAEKGSFRGGFIIKVFGIMSVMLVITVVWCIIVMNSISLIFWIAFNPWILVVSLVIIIAQACYMICCFKRSYNTLRKVPVNYIFTLVWTIAHALLVSAILPRYNPITVFQAFTCTMSMVIGVTLLACKYDIDLEYTAVAIMSLVMVVLTLIITSLFFTNKILSMIIIAVVIVLLSLYLLWDIKQVIGFKHSRFGDFIDPDDYVICAIIIYGDIISLFLYILQLLGMVNN